MPPRIVGIIPARYASTRLPGKALVPINGKPMIRRVYERCALAKGLDRLCVATDDERIRDAVIGFGGEAIMTRSDHPSGTDRLAEAVGNLEADIVVNIQGDQPFFDPLMIDEVIEPLLKESAVVMATLKAPVSEERDVNDPALVKVATDKDGFALYFSRSLIPYPRNESCAVYEHIGTYVYRRDFLLKLAQLPPTPLEQTESLEQLRVLENGYRIRVVETQCADRAFCGFGVDTPADLKEAEAMLIARGLE